MEASPGYAAAGWMIFVNDEGITASAEGEGAGEERSGGDGVDVDDHFRTRSRAADDAAAEGSARGLLFTW